MTQKIRLISIAIALLSMVACTNTNSSSEKANEQETCCDKDGKKECNKGSKKDCDKEKACDSKKSCDKDSKKDCEKSCKKDSKKVSWSHQSGETGPENWAKLCDSFSDCAGKVQSPINIESGNATVTASLPALKFSYGTSKVNIVNNGHTVQFNIDNPNNNVMIGDKNYQLLQFHYHALSEHTINGKHFPLEVHFVHKHSDSDFAVIGVMFEEGKENALLKQYLKDFPKEKGTFGADKTFGLLKQLPENKSYYHYNGSLTTPPCSEVVNWYVLNHTLEASKEQLAAFSKILHNNYRPVMPLNGRKVEAYIQK